MSDNQVVVGQTRVRKHGLRRSALVAAALIVALVAVLFFTLRSGSELDSLRDDPLAQWEPVTRGRDTAPTTAEADAEGSPSVEFYGPYPTLGDREGAIYTRTFLVSRGHALKPFESARRAALAAGWQMDYPDYLTANSAPNRTTTTVRGTKTLPTGDAIVYIVLDTAPKLKGAGSLRGMNSLTIMLEHTR